MHTSKGLNYLGGVRLEPKTIPYNKRHRDGSLEKIDIWKKFGNKFARRAGFQT